MNIVIEGRSYVTLEMICDCYGCEVSWMYQAYEVGLLGTGYDYEGRLVFAVGVLDRAAEVVRLGRYQNNNNETKTEQHDDADPELQGDD